MRGAATTQVLVWVAASLCPGAARAQESRTAEEALAAARSAYGVKPPRAAPCASSRDGEIVVCADIIDPETQRMPSPADRGEVKDTVPRAPYLGQAPCVPNLLTICADVGGKPSVNRIIDLEAIPEPPPGSDADRIAKGEIPAP